ncbi:glycosyltransferase [Arthrobacter sp. H16F315]|uniref:glycosyltransferase n=1 Tax=Arthrobacter sp. H16F315 TaxID=2955314 RepID=UPI00209793C1|nr:glycosyltransferase [Arthrobacter sp. H16F315]MDD1477241.1 glycosyltransferase [Arthrobacter sp. H16F315]
MKHSDEVAQTSAVNLAKRRRYTQDIDSLIQDYERLVKRSARQTRKIDDLEKHLRAMQRARDEFKGKFSAASKENVELKSTLRRLRSSASLRLGKRIIRPGRALLGLLSRLASSFRSMPGLSAKSSGRALQVKIPGAAPGPAEKASPPTSATPAPDAGTISEQLQSAFKVSPSRGALLKLVSHEYFVRGSIDSPAATILDNGELLADVSATERRILDNILGQHALLQSGVFLSPRQPNPGFLVERGRIMYCAHSTGHFNSNGYSTRTAGLVAGLRTSGEDLVVVARPGYPWDSVTDVPAPGQQRFERDVAGVPHIFNPGPNLSADRLDHYLMDAADVFVREAQRNRVAVIHAASNYVTALPALLAARRLGLPFVYEVRGIWEITELSSKPWWAQSDRYRLAVQLESFVVEQADQILAITTQVRDELVHRGADRAKIGLLPNSVDPDKFKPMPPVRSLRDKLCLPEESIVLGYAGSLVAYEGLGDLLAATKILVDRRLDVRLVVVGDGKQLPELKKSASDLGIVERVTFTGRVPAKSVADYMSLFDIMPCPRRRFPVTEMVSPLKPLEAMASGKAVVLSDLGPSRDLAGEGQQRALLCQPGDPDSLAEALHRLVADPELRTSIGRRARLWTIENRTWTQTAQTAAKAHQDVQVVSAADPAQGIKTQTIGIIADQFTLEGLLPEANFVVLRPDSWRNQLASQPIDALLVESAWEGVEGLWRQKVGYYGEEPFAVLKSLLSHCNARSVPTIFWNKEDPVHFNRFRVTAKHFDHVFTTDADSIRKYLSGAGTRVKTVASLPFYAQPQLHNILPSKRPYEHAVTYAGSYYGDKYPKRSAELSQLLTAARNFGLAVYDRQHLNPDSPYRFPPELDRFVRGGLSYPDMVDAYKAHPVHVNVNSVDSSPTMFSRRVMEIAASGGAVVSGTGRGVHEVLNGLVPVISGKDEAELLMSEWMDNEDIRARDAWLAYRFIHRGHTAAHRLAYMLRTAGLVVRAPEPPAYAVFLDEASPERLATLRLQTVRPRLIFSPVQGDTGDIRKAENLAQARQQAVKAGVEFLGTLPLDLGDRTVFEDLLTAATFGTWNSIGFTESDLNVSGLGLAQPLCSDDGLPRIEAVQQVNPASDLTMRRTLIRSQVPKLSTESVIASKTVVIAGHDLKFAAGIVDELRRLGHTVRLDRWLDHNKHDVEQSQALLKGADIVFCEWALGNALWYSTNKLPHQRLVIRVHSQELFRPFLKDLRFQNINSVVFVGQHIADIAMRDHNVPANKSIVVPNPVDIDNGPVAKADDARFCIGLVGIVPAQKHLDRALDVLKALRAVDPRYRLFVKGKRPEDFAWMAGRPEEMQYYEQQYARIVSDPYLAGAVTFDPHGDDMADWYQKIGVVLSVSDFESFHLTLADGAAAGAVPVSLAWPGSDQVYPTSWLAASVPEMVQKIRVANNSANSWREAASLARAFVAERFNKTDVLAVLYQQILGVAAGTDRGR